MSFPDYVRPRLRTVITHALVEEYDDSLAAFQHPSRIIFVPHTGRMTSMSGNPRSLTFLAVAAALAVGCTGSDKVSTESAQRLIDEADMSNEAVQDIPNDAKALVGSTEADFTRDAEARGYVVRVISRDGETGSADAAFVPNRLNVVVANEIVTQIINTG